MQQSLGRGAHFRRIEQRELELIAARNWLLPRLDATGTYRWLGAGDDLIDGEGGSDTILGGDGNDTLRGGGSDDTILGGDGDDLINGNSGNDTAATGEGDDTVSGVELIDETFILPASVLSGLNT